MSRSSLAAIMLLVLAPLSATAQTTEQREYQVTVNGKDAGTTRMTIVDDNAGGVTVKVDARVKFSFLFRTHTFTTDTYETWKDGKLVQLDADSTENNERTKVSLRPGQNGLVIGVNGAPRNTVVEAWPSNFCRLPDKKYYDPKAPLQVSIVEPDTGNAMLGDLRFVGKDKIVAASKWIECFKFKLNGIPTPTDLWYDEHHRLVREEYVENGQRMMMQLVSRKQGGQK